MSRDVTALAYSRRWRVTTKYRHCHSDISGANFFSQQADTNQGQEMSDQSVAAIARDLAKAMMTRAKTRLPDDQKVVLQLQTQLVAEVLAEKESALESLVLN